MTECVPHSTEPTAQELYDSVDGRRLVPFQAAMTQRAWFQQQQGIQMAIHEQLQACLVLEGLLHKSSKHFGHRRAACSLAEISLGS